MMDSGKLVIKKDRKEALEYAAGQTIAKTKPIGIRLSLKDLMAIQKKAEIAGLPYQTVINLILHQYAEGKIQITL